MLLAAVAVLAGAATQSATGFGFALLAGPALFALLEPAEAVGALAVLGVLMGVLVLADGGPGLIAWPDLGPLLLAAIPGLGLGLLVLDAFSKPALQIGVGVAVVAATLMQLPRGRREADGGRRAGGKGVAAAVGLLSGTLTTSIGINGPPIVLLLEARGYEPRQVRASLAGAFLALNVAGFTALVAVHGAGEVAALGRVLPLLGAVVVGHVLGALAFRRFDAASFRIAVLALAILAGAASVVAGLVSV